MGSSKLSMADSVGLDTGTFPSPTGSSAHCASGLSADGNNTRTQSAIHSGCCARNVRKIWKEAVNKKDNFVAAECERSHSLLTLSTTWRLAVKFQDRFLRDLVVSHIAILFQEDRAVPLVVGFLYQPILLLRVALVAMHSASIVVAQWAAVNSPTTSASMR